MALSSVGHELYVMYLMIATEESPVELVAKRCSDEIFIIVCVDAICRRWRLSGRTLAEFVAIPASRACVETDHILLPYVMRGRKSCGVKTLFIAHYLQLGIAGCVHRML